MRTIKISDAVWQAIAEKGKFGETEDDVLRRVFQLPSSISEEKPSYLRNKTRPVYATNKMSAYIKNGQYYVSFQNGESELWKLPEKYDKNGIKFVLDRAVQFAKRNNATIGQINAVRKALTDNGYYLTK